MTDVQIQRYFLLGLLAVTLGVLFFIFRPFVGALFVAITFAVVFYPVYRGLVRVMRGWESSAALLTVVLVLIIVIAPLLAFGWQIFQEASEFYLHADETTTTISQVLTGITESWLAPFFPQLTFNTQQYARQIAGWLFENLGTAFTSIAQFLFSLFLSLLTMYYTLKDGPRLLKSLIAYSPLLDRHDKKIIARLRTAVNSVLFGALVIALLQGFLAGLGFAFFGIPNPALWGSVAVVAALVPNIGTAIVIIPALLYLFLLSEIPAFVGLLIWSVLIVGLIDNLLRPKLIERGLRIHPLFILLAVLGGIIVFGPVGFLIGPLLLSLLFALLDIYPIVFSVSKKAD